MELKKANKNLKLKSIFYDLKYKIMKYFFEDFLVTKDSFINDYKKKEELYDFNLFNMINPIIRNLENYTKDDILKYLEFLIELELNNIRYITVLDVWSGNRELRKKYPQDIFYLPIYGELNKCNKQKINYNQNELVFISFPFRHEGFLNMIKYNRLNKFYVSEKNINGIYFPYIKAVFTYNGNHSSFYASSINSKEYGIYDVVDLSETFEHIDVDDKGQFYLLENKQVIKNQKFIDYRIALIYKLARIKWLLELDKLELKELRKIFY